MKSYILIASALYSWLLWHSATLAVGINEVLNRAGVSGKKPNVPEVGQGGTPSQKFYLLFLTVVEVILFVAGIAAVVVIVISGVRLTFSIGQEEQIEGAKKGILYATLGLLAVFLTFFVVQNITKIFI